MRRRPAVREVRNISVKTAEIPQESKARARRRRARRANYNRFARVFGVGLSLFLAHLKGPFSRQKTVPERHVSVAWTLAMVKLRRTFTKCVAAKSRRKSAC